MSDKTSDKISDEKASDKLLKCPFCGGEAELKYARQKLPFSGEINSFFVTCKNCGCSTPYFSEMNIYYSKDYKEKEKELKEKTIKTWNTRKPMEMILERLKEKHVESEKCPKFKKAFRQVAFEEAMKIVMEEGGLNE